MRQHQPDGHGALYALPYVTRFVPFHFRPRPVPAGRGPLFYLHPGRSPESQAKERQQRQDDERRQALNAKIPPMPGGKGGMKFRCLGHIFRTHFKPILGTFGTFCIHNNILFHIVILQSLRLITGRSQVRPLQGPPDFSGGRCRSLPPVPFQERKCSLFQNIFRMEILMEPRRSRVPRPCLFKDCVEVPA